MSRYAAIPFLFLMSMASISVHAETTSATPPKVLTEQDFRALESKLSGTERFGFLLNDTVQSITAKDFTFGSATETCVLCTSKVYQVKQIEANFNNMKAGLSVRLTVDFEVVNSRTGESLYSLSGVQSRGQLIVSPAHSE